MVRLFLYLMVILALALGFSWVANHPGIVTLNWQGMEIQTSLMVTIMGVFSLLTIVLLVWGLLRNLLSLPSLLSRFFFNRRRDQGYATLSKGLIAVGAGDLALARRMSVKSAKLLSSDPLVHLLLAQTALLEGDHKAAQSRFRLMLEDKSTKLLGLRGLHMEAEREGARDAAHQYADEASQLSPSLAWAGNAKLRSFSMEGNWEEALKTLGINLSAGLIDTVLARRHRAVLLTARAIAEEPENPALAAKLAGKAHRLAPDLVSAAVIGATALSRGNRLRKATRMVEATWKLFPHPELAEAYVNLRMGDSAVDRLKRAQTLGKLRKNHPESSMTVACAAIDSKDWQVARESMKNILADHPGKRACLVMAEIEEGEHGDAGRAREWLSKAVRSPGDAQWTTDGYVSKVWLPVSPVTGQIDAFEWKTPVERLQKTDEAIDSGDFTAPLKLLKGNSMTSPPDQDDREVGISVKMKDKNSGDSDNTNPKSSDEVKDKEGETEREATKESAKDLNDENSVDEEANRIPSTNQDKPKGSFSEILFPLSRRPDDPGIEKENPEQSKRSGAFWNR